MRYERGDWPGALDAYRQSLALAPEQPGVAFNLAQVFLRTSAPDSAIVALLRVVQWAPDDTEAHFLLAEVYRRLDRTAEARASYNRVLELGPDAARAESIHRYLEQGIAD